MPQVHDEEHFDNAIMRAKFFASTSHLVSGRHERLAHYSMTLRKNSHATMRNEIEEHMPAIWRFALSLSGRPDVADDLTQATCVRALEKQHQFEGDRPAIGWLVTICRSIWLNELRSYSVRKTGGMETAQPEDLIDRSSNVEMNILASQVYTRIMELPEAQRATVELVYVQQFTYSEAAGILDVPIGTIMSRLSTARTALAGLRDDAHAPVQGRAG